MSLLFHPIAGIVCGLTLGSFLATILVRWPAGKSVLSGRSRCDHCQTELTARELVPLFSFMLQSAKCRTCGQPINRDHPAIELTAALIGGLAFALAPGWEGVLGAVLGWQLLLLGALDVKHHWLPDRLTVLLVLSGVLAGLVAENPAAPDRLIGAAGGFAVLFVIRWGYFQLRGKEGLGLGDAKLLAGIGAWLGWAALPMVVLLASIVGLVGIFLSRWRGQVVRADTALPFGSYLAVAAFPLWLVMTTVPAAALAGNFVL